MKHLLNYKLFESVQLWEEIDEAEWTSMANERVELPKVYPNLFVQIRKIFGLPEKRIMDDQFANYDIHFTQTNKRIIVYNKNPKYQFLRTLQATKPGELAKSVDFCDFGVDATQDEWFIIHVNFYSDYNNYRRFKCDQLDGLFDLLIKIKNGTM